MKRSVILLLASLLTTIVAFSQIIYPKTVGDSLVIITAEQLKQTNLIFLEHSHLLEENKILHSKLELQDELIFNYQKMDSISRASILKLDEEVTLKTEQINKLTKRLNNHKIYFTVGSSALVITIVALLLK